MTHQPFIILAMPRTGSNFLSCLLHDHPQIVSIGEIFDKKTIWGQPGRLDLNHNSYVKLIRDFFPVFFLRRYIFKQYPTWVKAVGFRLFYHQAEIRQFRSVVPYLKSVKTLKVIHLRRSNLLRNLVSFRLAAKTRAWTSLKEVKSREILKLEYQECINYFINSEQLQNKYAKEFSHFPTIEIEYERLWKNTDKEIQKTLSFLGVIRRKLICSLQKQNTRPLSKTLINYWQLKKQFSRTRWSTYFLE